MFDKKKASVFGDSMQSSTAKSKVLAPTCETCTGDSGTPRV